MNYVCLDCLHTFSTREGDDELSKPRQCSQCWSYAVIPLERYLNVKIQTLEMMLRTPLGALPVYDCAVSVLTSEGLTLTPRRKLSFILKLHRDILDDILRGKTVQQILDETRKTVQRLHRAT